MSSAALPAVRCGACFEEIPRRSASDAYVCGDHALCRPCFGRYASSRSFYPIRCWLPSCGREVSDEDAELFGGAALVARMRREASGEPARGEAPREAGAAPDAAGEAGPVETLRRAMAAALHDGAVRRCPQCGAPGVKDLSCTHITCERCDRRYCYHCGESPEHADGSYDPSFRRHNHPYTLGSTTRCPLYLKYSFGDEQRGNRLDGDPVLSLRRFHTSRQITAVAALRESVFSPAAGDDAATAELERQWAAAVALLPGGKLYEPEDVAFLQRREEIVREHFARLIAREEEAARVAAERARLAEEARREAERLRQQLAERREQAQRESAARLVRRREVRDAHRAGFHAFIRARRAARQQAQAQAQA